MGRAEEKTGFMSSKWMTIILISVLVILAALLIWVLRDPRGFDRFKRKKRPSLKQPTVSQLPSRQAREDGEAGTVGLGDLRSVDSRLRVVAELSWQGSVLPPQV